MAETHHQLASRGDRLLGAIIDSLIVSVVIFSVLFFSGVFTQLAEGKPISTIQEIFYAALGVGVFLAINGNLLAKHGQTVGKKIVGVRIVGEDDKYLPLLKLIGLRYLPVAILAYIPYGNVLWFVDLAFIFRRDKRCLHDIIARTRVVNVGRRIR